MLYLGIIHCCQLTVLVGEVIYYKTKKQKKKKKKHKKKKHRPRFIVRL